MKKKILKTLSTLFIGLSLFSVKANAMQLEYGSYANINNTSSWRWITYKPTTMYAGSYQWYMCGNKWACATEDLRQSVANCWVYTNGKWYYIGSDGYMLSNSLMCVRNYDGVRFLGNTYYYLDSTGAMLTNTSVTLGGYTYNIDSEGKVNINL